MSFRDSILADLDTVFFNSEEFADGATYTPVGGGDGVAVTVLLEEGEQVDPDPIPGSVQDGAVLRVRETEVTRPSYGDVFMVGPESWTVTRPLSRDMGVWRLAVRRNTASKLRKK